MELTIMFNQLVFRALVGFRLNPNKCLPDLTINKSKVYKTFTLCSNAINFYLQK